MIDPSVIPQELRDRPQWLVWRSEPGEKKPKKMPYYVSGHRRVGKQGDDADRSALATFDKALAALNSPAGYTGIGFAFLPGDGLIGIDIDGCIDLETGEISQRANDIIKACGSYTEYSPSGKGVHIIVAGETTTFKSNEIGLEVFCGSQFFTFTAKPWPGSVCEIAPIAENVLNRLRVTVKGAKEVSRQNMPAAMPMDERTKLESALISISADCGYDDWYKIGMGIKSALGESGFDVWDWWSQRSAKYPGKESLLSHWKSFTGSGITEAFVYKMAVDSGWRPPKPPKLSLVQSPSPSNEKASGTSKASSGASGSGGGEKKGDNQEEKRPGFDNRVDELKKYFVLIYGTDEAWDSMKRMLIRIPHLRLAYGTDEVKFWLNWTDRRMVNKDQVVFDPSCTCDPRTSVNLFHGFTVKPKQGQCDKILALLRHLCDGDAELMAWILRWIAYPLQNPGAKMTTSVIMHGDEGSGKNLFWENIVRKIYGEYGGVIGNAQIESQFNEWASKKLFMVADEVVTRNELRQLKGKLKHLISGESIRVNTKNLSEREEANHMNFVFLSNELQPLALDKSDRRYLVVWTPPKQDKDFYREVAEQAVNGGIEAFYHYLLNVPLEGFNEHSQPVETTAKRNLISLGLSAPERFFIEWSGGFLPLPFMCCSAQQLYAGFMRWCYLSGERFPPSQTLFGSHIGRIGKGQISSAIIKYDLASVVKQRTVYLVGEKPADRSRTEWVEGASQIFEGHLKKYRNVYEQADE